MLVCAAIGPFDKFSLFVNCFNSNPPIKDNFFEWGLVIYGIFFWVVSFGIIITMETLWMNFGINMQDSFMEELVRYDECD